MRAFARVRERHPDLALTIVGREIDGQYAESVREIVQELNIGDAVRFTGHVETAELDTLYRVCRVFVFPSTVETFGNPLLEAMAAGAPPLPCTGGCRASTCGSPGQQVVLVDSVHDPQRLGGSLLVFRGLAAQSG